MLRKFCARMALAALSVFPSSALATQVHLLTGIHHHGQTFLTWATPGGTGWTYRVYAAPTPIEAPADLDAASFLGAVGDSTWCDKRLSGLTGIKYAYLIQTPGAPLATNKGLFVQTPGASGWIFYAVTAELGAGGEDTTLVLGQNSFASPIAESAGLPEPVYQRTLTQAGTLVEVYTLWSSHTGTSVFPAMANRAGMAFDCGLVRGGAAPQNALVVRPHARGGSFLTSISGTGMPGEWRLSLDDWIPNADRNTFWYGYHEAYDVTSNSNVAPVSGQVVDYTMRRAVFTLEWAERVFPIDPHRVYAFGGSMGGIGSVALAFRRPDLIAAVLATVPKFDFSFLTDPNPSNVWNTGRPERAVGDRLWGAVSTNLPTNEGIPVYDRLNYGALAELYEGASIPPIIAFNGRNDTVVGWAEKIGFYAAMRDHRQGGTFYFDQRLHGGGDPGEWTPMQVTSYLYRFRNDASFPALSRCTVDDDPGDGNAASGDSVGQINAFLEWDTTLVDTPDAWEVTLRLRDLETVAGTLPAPDSCRVDVTPRRLQALVVNPGDTFTATVRRADTDDLLESLDVTADGLGLITAPAILVQASGSRVRFERVSAGLPASPAGAGIEFQAVPSPLARPAHLRLSWPAAGHASAALYDVAGRARLRLQSGWIEAGARSYAIDPRDLPAGVYLLHAEQGGRRATCRVVVVK